MGLRGISWPRAERRSAVAAGGASSGLNRGTNINITANSHSGEPEICFALVDVAPTHEK